MNKIDALIAQLGDYDIPFEPLCKHARRNKGMAITAETMKRLDSPDGDVKVFAAGSTFAFIKSSDLPKERIIDKKTIIVKSRGYIGFEYYIGKFTHKGEMWSYSDFDDKLDLKFTYYYLLVHTEEFQRKARGNSVKLPQLCVADTDNFCIPILPLPVQQEIVRILDSFTDLQYNLQQELESRSKQLEYYRDSLFCSSVEEMYLRSKRGDFIVVPISSLGSLTRGKRFVKADSIEEGAPCIHYGEIYTYYGVSATKAKSHISYEQTKRLRHAVKNDVIIVGAGENNVDIGIGVAWFGDEEVAVHDACYTLHHNENPMYISHYLRSQVYHQQIKKDVSEGKICSISAQGIGRALIPLPSLSKQSEVVETLNAFEGLMVNIKAELAARQKQYEYYSVKLLTF